MSYVAARGAVLVTGASSGIGQSCALHLDQLGFRVFAGVRQVTAGKALKRAASERLTPIYLDVTDLASIQEAIDTIRCAEDSLGLMGLVNNAGITVWGPLEFVPLDELRKQLEVNVVGLTAVTQAAIPLLRAGRGRVVNIGSMSGKISLPFYGPYSASKFAVEALTDALRVELRPWDIQVSIIEPGVVATPIWEKTMALADAWMQHAPSEMEVLYAPAIAGVHANADRLEWAASPATDVAEAVGHALVARRPKGRYRVGQSIHTRFLLLLSNFPHWLRDAVIVRTLPRYP